MINTQENQVIIGIYKITSPSKRVYIGQSINVYNTWKCRYKYLSCKKQPKIYNSLKKYGSKVHIFEILEECTLDQLNERETYWKQYYLDQLGWKYMLFCELYDRGGGPKSEETKHKISQTSKGKIHSEETKNMMCKPKKEGTGKKISIKLKGRVFSKEHKNKISQNSKGKHKHSEESRLKISIGLKGKHKGNKMSEEVKQKIYTNERNLKISISLKGKPKSKDFGKNHSLKMKGHYSSPESNKKRSISMMGINNKSVRQYDKQMNFINEFESLTDACRYMNKPNRQGDITAACKGKQKTAFGYKWQYKSNISQIN